MNAKFSVCVLVVFLWGCTTVANASLNLYGPAAVTTSGPPQTITGVSDWGTDANLMGLVVAGTPPSGTATYIDRLATIVAGGTVLNGAGSWGSDGQDYYRSNKTFGSFPAATEDVEIVSGTPISAGVLALEATYDYISAKYDAEAAGTIVWRIEDWSSALNLLTGKYDVTLPTSFANRGLSNIRLFNETVTVIPEPASLLVWGGLAVAGLCVARRRMRSK